MLRRTSTYIEPDSTTNIDFHLYMDYIEEFPNDLQKWVTQFKEIDSQLNQTLQLLEVVSRLLTEENSKTTQDILLIKGKLMAQKMQDFNEEKLNCCIHINNLITNKYQEFNADQVLHNEPWDLTPGKFIPTQSSTPIDPRALKKVPKKRGRKSKLSKENVEKSSAVSVQESASSTCDLMMLADIAVTTLHEEEARTGKFGKLPVTKHSKKNRGRKKESKDQADETTDSDIGQGEGDDNEPLYCVCNRPSFGNMVECSNDACSIEWFHFSCIGMRKAPKGKWYCLKCRSNRNIRKIKKELEA